MAKTNKQNVKQLFQLAVWLLVGLLLALLTLSVFSHSSIFGESGIEGGFFVPLLGGGVFVVFMVLLIVALMDFMYVALFVRWIFFGRKQQGKDDRTLYLP